MGHSHSSSHKRLRSISSSKNYCGEFTEVVDLEFSDVVTEALGADTPQPNMAENAQEIVYPSDLILIEAHVNELEDRVSGMSSDEFFVYFPTLKDDLHNCWQKVYAVKEQNLETRLKKYKIIDQIREALRRLNERLQRSSQH